MVFSKFDSLSVRPPTPPRDLHDHEPEPDTDATLQFLQDPFGDKPVLPRIAATKAVLNTPEQSPSSDISIPSSTGSRRKRVEFELQTCANPTQKAIAQSWTPTRSSPLRPLPQTRVSKPLKSILKPADGTETPPPSNDQGAAAHKFKTFAEMLESIVKLLASAERPSRLDAYHSLQRTMQAYDKIPDDQALKQKMSLLAQFIRRDIQASSPTGAGLDSQLITQALKLLMALFRITDLMSSMDDDFCSFIVDRIILVASDGSMPKTIVNTHLAVLMQQSFRPRAMSTARVEKILDVLDTIQERVSGFSVQAYRIRIYRKLIQQRQDIMIKHTERWFKHTVKALVSGQKDINQSALDTAIAAAKHIGHDRHVARSVLVVLNRIRSDGDTLARVMTREMGRMLDGDNAALVPQIWSAVTGLLQDSMQGNMFLALKEWLEVFEKCFKSNKESVKIHANVALCFLCYAVNLSKTTSEAWTKMFSNISLGQLLRRNPRISVRKPEGDAITGGYITLLYYSFRPDAPFEQYDRFWRDFIMTFWTTLVRSTAPSSQHALAACRIVSALLNGSRKPWNEHRALDLRPQCLVQRGELPLIDPRWVRKSLPLILSFVEILFENTPWMESELCEDKPIQTMWLAVLNALVEASSKEVMASSETKDAMAHIVNLLRRIWDSHTAELANSQQKEDLWTERFCFLVDTIIEKLGASRFADKCLTRNAERDLEVASTPSHRSKPHAVRTSPLLYLIDLLVNQSEGKLADTARVRVLLLIIAPCFDVQGTRLSKLELLRDCAATVDSSFRATVASRFWEQLAALLQRALQTQDSDSVGPVARPLGKEYDLVVDLLRAGSTGVLNKSQGREVLSSFVDVVRKEAGDGAVVLAVIEKVSDRVLKGTSDQAKISCLPYATVLLRNLPKQVSRRILDQGSLKLWPSSPAHGRNSDFDPYNHLYAVLVSLGTAAYQDMNDAIVDQTKQFLNALTNAIQQTPTSHLAVFLRKIQEVIGLWVEDPEKKMHSKDPQMRDLHHEVVCLWTVVNKAIERLPRKDAQILLHLETIITAGFLNRHRSIVNASIATWNNTFGKEASLRYPSRLEQALRDLRNTVELSLPSLPARDDDSVEELLFYDSDNGVENMETMFKSPRVKNSPFKVTKPKTRSMSRSPAMPSTVNRRIPSRQTLRVRLRHDNSQIQFEPILSSPSNPFNQESQILTERQQEMVERQRLTTGLFANLGAQAIQPETVVTPMEFHSDAPSADEYMSHGSRTTPLKALAAIGPMDVFLGSSPTPHARRTTRDIIDEVTSVTTPTANRSRLLAQEDELGSSPPRFDKDLEAAVGIAGSDVQVGSSFDHRQPEASFDDGTTLDEEALLAIEQRNDQSEAELPDDAIMTEVPSSTIDLQLTAQIDADMQAQILDSDQVSRPVDAESVNDFVDATSYLLSGQDVTPSTADDAEINDSQPASQPMNDADTTEVATSSTSRVDDSFNRSPSTATPRAETRSLRRSSRHSLGSSPAASKSAKRRGRTPSKRNKKEQNEPETVRTFTDTQSLQEPTRAAVDDDVLDTIVVVSPVKKQALGTKRKSATDERIMTIPETNRKRGMRRSQSLLSQVENSQDVLVEDTPAPKRARQSLNQDVSEAKITPPPAKDSQTKRLSHVRVTPRSSSRISQINAEEPIEPGADGVEVAKDAQASQNDQSTSQQPASAGISTPSRSFTERVILTPRSIINQLRSLKDYLFSAPHLILGQDEEREIDDTLFHIRRQVHAAGLRSDGKQEK
ncbi:hypothetical protein ACN47E_000098 [Coniothyrium glycines]